jgi:hypothetical protein
MIPIIKMDGKELPILIHGTSPFIGAGQFGSKAESYYRRFYLNPSLMSQFFVYFSTKCYPCIHISPHPPILEAMEIATEIRSINVIATVESKNELELIANLDPMIVFLHGSRSDMLNEDEIKDFSKACNDLGMVPGIATHKPGTTILEVEKLEAVRAYMVPVNPLGLYMEPSFDSTLIAIEHARRNDKYIIGMKTLAGGRINPYKGFPFALNYCHAIVVGFTEFQQIDEAVSLVKKIEEGTL